jgi:hypothetical protein
MNTVTWQDNRALMGELWPKWRLEPSLSRLMDKKWGQLHQDKLRECIEQHRLERDSSPDISAIHKAYCKITGTAENGYDGRQDAVRTRTEVVTGPTAQEYAEWDEWAAGIMASATPQEIAEAKARYGFTTDRVVAIAIDNIRRNGMPNW